jgi:hypothetical protein
MNKNQCQLKIDKNAAVPVKKRIDASDVMTPRNAILAQLENQLVKGNRYSLIRSKHPTLVSNCLHISAIDRFNVIISSLIINKLIVQVTTVPNYQSVNLSITV